jgi:hypothetical protein
MIEKYCYICNHSRKYKWWQRLWKSDFGWIGTFCPNCKAKYGEIPDGYELVPRECSDIWVIKEAIWINGKPYRKVR